ncbi:MAG TPA: hypothetical protein VD768_08850 [Sphingomicrobium sp.]|nr:hypothetical protein [Sphingomicrobium sp.]
MKPKLHEYDDAAIIAALRGGTPGRGRVIPHLLYAPAQKGGGRMADTSQWFITGPRERPGYLPGPISPRVVNRLARNGVIVPDTEAYGQVQSYRLA